MAEARAIALKSHPGEITDEELEKERGGSGLRYSFDIKRGAVTQEVGVDAQTGTVLENAQEGPNPDQNRPIDESGSCNAGLDRAAVAQNLASASSARRGSVRTASRFKSVSAVTLAVRV